jgi:membrane-associated phospholipid phosphatase
MSRQLSERAAERAATGGTSRHGPVAQLLIAWSPLTVILLIYGAAQWISAPLATGNGAPTNRLGASLHVLGPAGVDHAVFGANPSAWLQSHLAAGGPHWYDLVAAVVYATHVVSIPLVTGLVWFRLRDRFVAWLGAVLALTLVGVTGYVLYPAAPPWLAAATGDVPDVHHVDRLSGRGWDYLHLGPVRSLTSLAQGQSNPVAAMPSLHAGTALLVTVFLWPVVRAGWRGVLVAYTLVMALTLVYTGEHYVVDVLAGWLTASVAAAVGWALLRLRTTPTAPLRTRTPADRDARVGP